MKGPYIICNSKGVPVCQGYSVWNTNEEGRQHALAVADAMKRLFNEHLKQS